jgi:ATP-dependent protease ClpP protease subunit
MGLLGVETIEGAISATTFVDAKAQIVAFGEHQDGDIFIAKRGNEIAVGISMSDSAYVPGVGNLAVIARRAGLGCRAEIVDRNGLMIVNRVIVQGHREGSSVWDDRIPRAELSNFSRTWQPALLLARTGERKPLDIAPTTRPRGGATIEINLVGEIGDDGLCADDMVARVRAAGDATISMNIDSPGGSVDGALGIYRALVSRRHAVCVNIVRAESAAAIIALAGDTREIVPDGRMLLHKPFLLKNNGSFQAGDLRNIAADLDKLADEIAGIVAIRAGVTFDVAREWIEAETTFNAGQAVASGMCHGISQAAPLIARAPRARFAPINGPFAAARPAQRPPRLFEYSAKLIPVGDLVRHKGETFCALRNTIAAPGLEPDRDLSSWRRVC